LQGRPRFFEERVLSSFVCVEWALLLLTQAAAKRQPHNDEWETTEDSSGIHAE
jgi:hypothetical protein